MATQTGFRFVARDYSPRLPQLDGTPGLVTGPPVTVVDEPAGFYVSEAWHLPCRLAGGYSGFRHSTGGGGRVVIVTYDDADILSSHNYGPDITMRDEGTGLEVTDDKIVHVISHGTIADEFADDEVVPLGVRGSRWANSGGVLVSATPHFVAAILAAHGL